MSVIKIGSNNYGSFLQKRIAFEVDILKEDNIIINIDKITQGTTTIFKCFVNNEQLEKSILKEFIANVLSDVIINHLEVDFLYKILENNYKYFNKNKKDRIVNIARNRLSLLTDNSEKISAKIERKNRTLLEILDYLKVGKEIILEGFVQFRLKSYLAELELAVNNAIEEYEVEKEYKGFVYLLKCYIDNQQFDSKLVNVVKVKDEFKLLNNEKKEIKNPFLDQDILGKLEQDLDYEDLLISALITIAPEQVILHFKHPSNVVENLKNVFADRLSICLGCKYCKVDNYKGLE